MRIVWCAAGAGMASVIAMTACQVAPHFFLRNNTGGRLVLILAGETSATQRPFDRREPLGAGKTERLFNSEANRGLRLTSSACEYRYENPLERTHPLTRVEQRRSVETYSTPPLVRIEADFQIYILPDKAPADLPIGELKMRQPQGFPVAPSSKTCP